MKASFFRATWRLGALVPSLLVSLPASAGHLEATITGQSGEPRPYVRVELIGPEDQQLFTTQEGKLSAELPGGSYVLRVTDRNRRMEFHLDVPQRGQLQRTLKLDW
jgi:hypothetical protein